MKSLEILPGCKTAYVTRELMVDFTHFMGYNIACMILLRFGNKSPNLKIFRKMNQTREINLSTRVCQSLINGYLYEVHALYRVSKS